MTRPVQLIARSRHPFASASAYARLGALCGSLILLTSSLANAPAAEAVLITIGDGTGNTVAPAADPGFDHVGVINGLSGVYVRNGWVLTANHVGESTINLGGVDYAPIVGSRVRFRNPDSTLADLIAFKIRVRPPLSDLLITNNAPNQNSLVTLIGNGRNRGAPTTYMGTDGFLWGIGASLRWGTNRVSHLNQLSLDTRSFWVLFDDLQSQPGGQAEADVVTGDSGGGAFTGSGASAELVGILFARAAFMGQPSNTSIYGNVGIISDLFFYRDEILAVIDQPDCDDGLDDDADGFIDYPADPGCASPTDSDETSPFLVCDNGLDDDGDGLVDLADPGCSIAGDTSERGAVFECDNGLDDDDDLLFDYPDDDDCFGPTDPVEAPEPSATALIATGVLGLTGLGRRRSNRIARRSGR